MASQKKFSGLQDQQGLNEKLNWQKNNRGKNNGKSGKSELIG